MKGQTLIELMVALAVAGIIITAISITVVKSLNTVQLNKNKNTATQYAQEGMEFMRNKKNQSFEIYDGYAEGKWCLDDTSTLSFTASSCTTNVGIFTREIDIDKNETGECGSESPDKLIDKVTVRVSWNDAGCSGTTKCHKEEQTSCFSNLYSADTPGAPVPPPPTDCGTCALFTTPNRACLFNPCSSNPTNPICESEQRTCGTNPNCYGHICINNTM
jgi:prepilin-type N-terminal cleavage/methylation domain-containing protein